MCEIEKAQLLNEHPLYLDSVDEYIVYFGIGKDERGREETPMHVKQVRGEVRGGNGEKNEENRKLSLK